MALTFPNKISWQLLSEGINYYQKQDFEYREIPWRIPVHIADFSAKNMMPLIPRTDGYMAPTYSNVTSGEQSFFNLELNGELPRGRYMAVTPCFNNEIETEFQKRQFVKLELYITNYVTMDNLHDVIKTCQSFFKKFIWKWPIEKINTGHNSFKLVSHDITLGSYGINEYNNLKWIYATGMAEPRLSQVRVLSIRDSR